MSVAVRQLIEAGLKRRPKLWIGAASLNSASRRTSAETFPDCNVGRSL
jgi:hypothetical protein